MAKAKVQYSYASLHNMLRSTTDRKTICTIIIIALSQWGERKLNDYEICGLFETAVSEIKSI